MTANEIRQMLHLRYADRQRYAVFDEFADGTGAGQGSWVDVAVFHLWPSDGQQRHAYEIKVSRSDFMHEIQMPRKNQWARESFHAFFYVTAPGVVKTIDEIPEGCGWMLAGKRLVIKKAATFRHKPEMGEWMISSAARSLHKQEAKDQKRLRDEILSSDAEVLRASAAHNAVRQFLSARGQSVHHNTAEGFLEALEAATMDKAAKEEQKAARYALESFQDEILGLFWRFCDLAFVSLDATDETGKKLHGWSRDRMKSHYGKSEADWNKRMREMLALWKESQKEDAA